MSQTLRANSAKVANSFHALSDPTRIEIVSLLRSGERCVCELMDELDAAQSRLSFHLKVLKDAGIVTDRKEGRWMYYTLSAGAFDEMHDFIAGMNSIGAGYGRRLAIRGECCK